MFQLNLSTFKTTHSKINSDRKVSTFHTCIEADDRLLALTLDISNVFVFNC